MREIRSCLIAGAHQVQPSVQASLETARVVSFLGDALGLVALILYVTEQTNSAGDVALLLLAGDFTPSLLSPVLGAIADRTEPRRLMIVCELGQALAVGLIARLQLSIAYVLVLVRPRRFSPLRSRRSREPRSQSWWTTMISSARTHSSALARVGWRQSAHCLLPRCCS